MSHGLQCGSAGFIYWGFGVVGSSEMCIKIRGFNLGHKYWDPYIDPYKTRHAEHVNPTSSLETHRLWALDLRAGTKEKIP